MRALRVMLAADPDQARIRALRRAIAQRIEADLELLDRLDGDPDCEDGFDCEQDAGDECEVENEHGGDIQDEPHDAEEDCDDEECHLSDFDMFSIPSRAHDERLRALICDARLGLDRIRARRRRKVGDEVSGLRVLGLGDVGRSTRRTR